MLRGSGTQRKLIRRWASVLENDSYGFLFHEFSNWER